MAFDKFLISESEAPIHGTQKVYKFDNGMGASVISETAIHRRDKNLWEVAVAKWDGDIWDINYNTPVTSDVLRALTQSEVESTLRKISKLEKGVY